MEVNNIELIKPFINCNEGEFYLLQLIHRSKDGLTKFDSDDKKFYNKTIKSYYITSPEYLDRKTDEIKELCHLFNARAYINLNKKSRRQVALKTIENIAHYLSAEDYTKNIPMIDAACGQTGACDKNKSWIVDIDTKNVEVVDDIKQMINSVEPFYAEDKILLTVPTIHGYHLISKPFNKAKFNEIYNKKYPEKLDIHDNNPTILYAQTKD